MLISGKPEISVSFRSRKSARCTRPGQEGERRGAAATLNLIHLSNSPSQRFACPLKSRARAPRFSLFLLPKRGAERREGANLSRLRSATNHAVEAWCASCGTRPPLGAPPWRFWAGGRASVSGIASGECVQRAPRSAGHSAWRAGSRAFRASGYEPPPRNATPRSASRTVSRNARHPNGDNS